MLSGVAHIVLTVRNAKRSHKLYKFLFVDVLGLTPMVDNADASLGEYALYCVGGRTAVGLVQATATALPFAQLDQAGLHHLCFRLKRSSDVDTLWDRVKARLEECGGRTVTEPRNGPWAPGYRYVLFEDADGIRLEFNHVPGKGLLAKL